MKLDSVIASPRISSALKHMIESGRIPHAIMLSEESGEGGALALALAFACEIFFHQSENQGLQAERLTHPDLHFLFPIATSTKFSSTSSATCENYFPTLRESLIANPYISTLSLNTALGIDAKAAAIPVAEAERIIGCFAKVSASGGMVVTIVLEPEKMNIAAANKLLKSLEEPPSQCCFILVSHASHKVLQTIASRCYPLSIPPHSKAQRATLRSLYPETSEGSEADFEAILSDLLDGILSQDLGKVLDFSLTMDAVKSKELRRAFCEYAASVFRQIFLLQQNLADFADDFSPRIVTSAASGLSKLLPRKAAQGLDEAVRLLERNVSAKMVFCDFAIGLYRLQNAR